MKRRRGPSLSQHPSKLDHSVPITGGQESSTSLDIRTISGHSERCSSESPDHRTVRLRCAKCGYGHVVQLRCGRRSCAVCRRSQYARLLRNYLKISKSMRNPKLLTLTTIPSESLSRERLCDLRKAFQRLLHRRYFRERIRGGLYILEVKHGALGWNVHLHALIDSAYLEQQEISSVWRELTGKSYIVDVRQARMPIRGLKYILKYVLKPPILNGRELLYDRVLRRTRLVQTFGLVYRIRPEKRPFACPVCAATSWLVVSGAWSSSRHGYGYSQDVNQGGELYEPRRHS